jgi:hypothetical protein
VVNHFITKHQRPIVCIHDSFICSVRDAETLILLMADYYSIIVGEVGMRGIKGTAQEFSEPLMSAINKCFEQETDGMTTSSWDALVAKEGVNDPPSIEAAEEDVSDAEAL